jgi:hypothetical protein
VGLHAEELHDFLAGETSSVNARKYEEKDDNEVGSINTIAGEVNLRADKGLRTPDKSWLDLEDEDNFEVYHVHVIVNEDEPCELGSCCSSDKEYTSQLEESCKGLR